MNSRLGRKGTVLTVTVLAATAIAGGALAAVVAHRSTTSTKIRVTETDYKLALSKRTAPAGRITFVVHNKGMTDHEFAVKGNGVHKGIRGLIAPGTTKSLTVTLKKGTYTLYCKLHISSGMKKAFKVGGGSSAATTTSGGGGGWG